MEISHSPKDKNAGWNMTANDPALATDRCKEMQLISERRRVTAMQTNAEADCKF